MERRTTVRITPKGAVIVRADTYVLRGRVGNVSRRGLLAHTAITAPERLLGASAELTVRLDGADATWLELSGTVLRIGSRSVALGLDVVPPSFPQILDQAISRSAQNDRAVAVVLVDGVRRRRRAMASAFRRVGCVVVEASTPLEAIVRLGGSHFEPDLIVIGDSEPALISDELRRFAEVEHPRAMLVTVGDAADAPTQVAHWLSAIDGAGELAERIRDVLSRLRSRA